MGGRRPPPAVLYLLQAFIAQGASEDLPERELRLRGAGVTYTCTLALGEEPRVEVGWAGGEAGLDWRSGELTGWRAAWL